MIHSSAARREELLSEIRSLRGALTDEELSGFLSDAFPEVDVTVSASSFTPEEIELMPIFFQDAPRPSGGVMWELSREYLLNSLNDSRLSIGMDEDARRDRNTARQAIDSVLSRRML